MVSYSEIKKGLYRYKEIDGGWVISIKNAPNLLKAAEKIRDAQQISYFDCFSPFPIHGLEKAMGLNRSWVPFFTLIFGLIGCVFAFSFMSYIDIFSWPMNIGGKPHFAWPAYIPITFEITILFAGLATVGAVVYLGRLGKISRSFPIKSVTSTDFAIWVGDKISQTELSSIVGDLAEKIIPVCE